MTSSVRIVSLSEMQPGQTADCFVLLADKERGTTRDGKPFFRLTFRDNRRTVSAMVWHDSAFFDECNESWTKGDFYKLRCTYLENQYGEQVDLDRVRIVIPEDAEDGFDAADFFPSTRFDAQAMFGELLQLAEENITDPALKQLVTDLLNDHEWGLLTLPAATRNHHAFAGGFLEHVLSVTKTALYLAKKYAAHYPVMQPPLSVSLVVAGAILHDIGKLIELDNRPQGTEYTAAGRLIGHILLGRDLVREAASQIDGMDSETLLRLEHIIVAHQNRPEWGSPIPPLTPEALLVHYADDVDAKFHMMATSLEEPPSDDDEEFTHRNNALRRNLFRGLRRT